ncbi:MAG: AAA domain-containing protein [Gemmatimonadota bacterium]|nr:AAA domain-containing protein [Gemmatimonadota bacterium]
MDSERPASLADLLDGCAAALLEEVDAVRQDLARRGIDEPVPAGGGLRVESPASGFLYQWTLPAGRYEIRTDDAVRVEGERGAAFGFVAAWDARSRVVRVRSGDWLGPHPGPSLLTFDPTWLLEAQEGRLREIAAAPDRFHPDTALRLFGVGFPGTGRAPVPQGRDEGLDPAQREALSRILGSRTQLVWGPPGTGKTVLLGHAVDALADEGRVLVVATTNVAVDEAAVRIAARLGPRAVAENRLLRIGAEFSATGDPSLSLEAAVARAEAAAPGPLTRAIDEIERELLDGRGRAATDTLTLAERTARAAMLARREEDGEGRARAARLATETTRAARRVLDGARIVATTFARLAVRDELAAQRFASVVIDEAGAAPLPAALFAACLAADRAVAFGDFQQLPAVVTSRGPGGERWLRRDLFRETGVLRSAVEGEDDGTEGPELPDPADGLCAMLDRQYRMRPAIRALVSDLFYGGRLRDAPEVHALESRRPGLVLVDTDPLSPAVERAEGSRANPVHVDVVLQVLEVLARAGLEDVAVVTPYRTQTRRILRLARTRLGRLAPAGLEVSTIHRFQGREKRVVVLDTVDAPPGASWFLDERRNPEFPRLLNVALSRARELLVVVATPRGLRATLPEQALLNRVVERMGDAGTRLAADRPADLARVLGGRAHS